MFHPGVVTMLAAANWWMLLAGLVMLLLPMLLRMPKETCSW